MPRKPVSSLPRGFCISSRLLDTTAALSPGWVKVRKRQGIRITKRPYTDLWAGERCLCRCQTKMRALQKGPHESLPAASPYSLVERRGVGGPHSGLQPTRVRSPSSRCVAPLAGDPRGVDARLELVAGLICHSPRTTRVGTGARRMICSAPLPRKTRPMPLRPCVPTTIKSAPHSRASVATVSPSR